MKLSIIVPVYNVEKYLPRCLDSLLRQGMEPGEYEVICVNDGSQDNCAAILAEYESKHPDIFKVVTQENKGLGEARNTGMRVAQGEYIGFVDSDDYVVDNGFRFLCDHFLGKKPSVLQFGSKDVENAVIDRACKIDLVDEVIYEGDGAGAYNRRLKSVQSVVWKKFYSRLFLREYNIWFDQVLTEDTIFNFHVFRHNPYIVITGCPIYRYVTENQDSIMRSKAKEKICALIDGQLYGLNLMSCYLQNGNALLREGVEKCIYGSLNMVYRESYSLRFSKREWEHYMRKIRKLGVNGILCEYERGIARKMISHLKISSSHSWLMYMVVGFIYRNVIEKYVLPKL